MLNKFLLASSMTLLALPAMGQNANQIAAIQQAEINQLQKLTKNYPEVDLLKIWNANRVTGNIYNPADGGSLEATFDNGVVTVVTPVGSHHVLAGMVQMEGGIYQVEVVAIPSTQNHNWTERSSSQSKTAGFYARVGSATASVPAIETANFLKTETGSFNGTVMSSQPIAPALTFTSAPTTFSAGTQPIWVGFNPYAGAKKLQIVSAVLKRIQ